MRFEQALPLTFTHRLQFTREVFAADNRALADVLRPADGVAADPARVLVFMDEEVGHAWPDLPAHVRAYAERHADVLRLAGPIHRVPGGEACKNDRTVLDTVCWRLHDAGLDRQSYVLAIGGGAVLDVVGFAAAIVHRGVRLVRVPSTTLAQADSGVGVKNGVNAFGKKNFLGSFAVPWAVLCDEALLSTLTDADWRSGFSEAVKVALVKDAAYYAQIARTASAIRARDAAAGLPVIRRSAELHYQHILHGGDPFELQAARPLDFGHWSAHKLEQLTDFTMTHGHAVAIGIALDATYSALVGLLDPAAAAHIRATLADLGLPTYHPALAETPALLAGIEEFREHLGGRLHITLLRAPGDALDVHEMDAATVKAAVQQLADTVRPRPTRAAPAAATF